MSLLNLLITKNINKKNKTRLKYESPLDILYHRQHIDNAQYEAGIALRHDWEISQPTITKNIFQERVGSSSRKCEYSPRDSQLNALERIKRAFLQQNKRGRKIVIGVCIEKKDFKTLSKELNVESKYISERFKEAMDDLAVSYNLAAKRHRANTDN